MQCKTDLQFSVVCRPDHILQCCLTFQPNVFTETVQNISHRKQKGIKELIWQFLSWLKDFWHFNIFSLSIIWQKITLYWFFWLAFFFCYHLKILKNNNNHEQLLTLDSHKFIQNILWVFVEVSLPWLLVSWTLSVGSWSFLEDRYCVRAQSQSWKTVRSE